MCAKNDDVCCIQEGSPWPANGFGRVAKTPQPEEGTPTSSQRTLPEEEHCDVSSSEVKPRRDTLSAAQPSSQQDGPQLVASSQAEVATVAAEAVVDQCADHSEAAAPRVAEGTETGATAEMWEGSVADADAQQDELVNSQAPKTDREMCQNSAPEQEQHLPLLSTTVPPATPVPLVDRIEPDSPGASASPQPSPMAAGAARLMSAAGAGCVTPEAATPDVAAGGFFETPGFFDPMFTPAADLGRPTSAQPVRQIFTSKFTPPVILLPECLQPCKCAACISMPTIAHLLYRDFVIGQHSQDYYITIMTWLVLLWRRRDGRARRRRPACEPARPGGTSPRRSTPPLASEWGPPGAHSCGGRAPRTLTHPLAAAPAAQQQRLIKAVLLGHPAVGTLRAAVAKSRLMTSGRSLRGAATASQTRKLFLVQQ